MTELYEGNVKLPATFKERIQREVGEFYAGKRSVFSLLTHWATELRDARAKLDEAREIILYVMDTREIRCLRPFEDGLTDCGEECAYHRAVRFLMS